MKSRLLFSSLGFSFLVLVIALAAGKEIALGQSSVPLATDAPLRVEAADSLFTTEGEIANCRYGVVSGFGKEKEVSRIGAGLHLDFNPPRTAPAPSNNAEFVHIFEVFQRKTQDGEYLPGYRTVVPLNNSFADIIHANPGDLWLIGNEIDRGPNPGMAFSEQGDMFPEVYAQAYHEVRAFIKQHDPTARIAIAGLVEVTPGRLQYLDKVWNAYQARYNVPMPVDVWNMHVYVLPEVEPDGITPNGIASVAVGTDPSLGKRSSGGSASACSDPDVYCLAEHDDTGIFQEQVIAMRQWMKDHGQQQKPLILSEYSLLFPYVDEGETCYVQDEYGGCFTPERVTSFMTQTFNLLNTQKSADLGYGLDDNRLVQQWVWFSIFTKEIGTVSNILENDRQTLSAVGKRFQQTTFAETPVVNLVTESIPRVVAIADTDTGKATANLRVIFRNNGNTAVDKPFKVTFYLDPGREKPFGSVKLNETVRGCATNQYVAEFQWENLSPGVYFYWTALDSEDVIPETPAGPADNLGFGVVVVNEQGNYLPVVVR